MYQPRTMSQNMLALFWMRVCGLLEISIEFQSFSLRFLLPSRMNDFFAHTKIIIIIKVNFKIRRLLSHHPHPLSFLCETCRIFGKKIQFLGTFMCFNRK